MPFFSVFLGDGLFVLSLTLLAGAIGSKLVLQFLRLPTSDLTAAERVGLCGALGFGILQYVFLSLGALKALWPFSVGLVLLALWAASARTMLGIVSAAAVYALALRPAGWDPMAKVLAIAIAAALCIAAILAGTPITDADGTGYHVPVLKWWLEAHTLIEFPTILPSYWPMGGEMVMGLGFAVWSDTSVKMIHWAFGVLALVALYAAGNRLTNPVGGLTAAALFLAFSFPLFSWAYIDLGVALFVATATLAVIHWLQAGDVRWLRAAALCAGFAGSFKLSLVVFGMSLIVVSIPILCRSTSPRGVLVEVLRLAALATIPIAPWLFRTWMLTGNPVYPFLSFVFPTPGWSSDTAWAFREYYQHYNWGVTHPEWSHGLRQALRLSAFGLVLFLTAWGAFGIRTAVPQFLALLTGLAALNSIWSLGLYWRHTLPLMPLFLLCALSLAASFWAKQAVRFGVSALATLAIVAATAKGSAGSLGDSVAYQAGSLSRVQFLKNNGFNMDMAALARRYIPSDANAIVYPAKTYYYDFRNLWTLPFNQGNIRFDNWENFNDDIDRMKVRYFICAEAVTINLQLPIYAPSLNEQMFLRRLVAERAEKVAVVNGDALWQILPRRH
jgi:hypothetical protein